MTSYPLYPIVPVVKEKQITQDTESKWYHYRQWRSNSPFVYGGVGVSAFGLLDEAIRHLDGAVHVCLSWTCTSWL